MRYRQRADLEPPAILLCPVAFRVVDDLTLCPHTIVLGALHRRTILGCCGAKNLRLGTIDGVSYRYTVSSSCMELTRVQDSWDRHLRQNCQRMGRISSSQAPSIWLTFVMPNNCRSNLVVASSKSDWQEFAMFNKGGMNPDFVQRQRTTPKGPISAGCVL